MLKKKWNRKEIIMLAERLELYLSAGLTIDQALQSVKEGIPNKKVSSIDSVQKMVREGGLLSKALLKFVSISATTAGLIEHGELSGNLSKSCRSARELLEREDELLRKCLSALTYPLVIGIFAILLTVGLMKGVMPQIIPMLKGLQVTLPLITRIVMKLSEFLISYGIFIGIGLVVMTMGLGILYRKVDKFKLVIQYVLFYIPFIGNLVYSFTLSIFLYSCGSLIESGLYVSESYTKTLTTVSYVPFRNILEAKMSDISGGVSIGKILKERRVPGYVPALLLAGEASGTLGASMIRAASIIDRDISNNLKKLTSLIEPMMMAGMGCMVGTIAVSIMLPIYDISKVLQH